MNKKDKEFFEEVFTFKGKTKDLKFFTDLSYDDKISDFSFKSYYKLSPAFKTYIESLGVTQAFLCSKLGFSRSYFNEMISGKRFLNEDKRKMIAEVINEISGE